MTVKDLEKREELELITNSQDIESICKMIGRKRNINYGCLFVEVLSGEYGDIYACEHSVPYLHYEVKKIH
jgi:hypothetical protein